MANNDFYGWWGVKGRPTWICPKCNNPSSFLLWKALRAECEDCGDHDARQCPKCKQIFDHCGGDFLIENATREYVNKEFIFNDFIQESQLYEYDNGDYVQYLADLFPSHRFKDYNPEQDFIQFLTKKYMDWKNNWAENIKVIK